MNFIMRRHNRLIHCVPRRLHDPGSGGLIREGGWFGDETAGFGDEFEGA